MSTDKIPEDKPGNPLLGLGLSGGLGTNVTLVERLKREAAAWDAGSGDVAALLREAAAAIDDAKFQVGAYAVLPALPKDRVLASGTIAGKHIELLGWHTDDLEIWARIHGFKFGA